MDKLSVMMISRHDVPSRKGKEVKRYIRRALSSLDESVIENSDDDEKNDVVNHGRKSLTHQNPLCKTWHIREFGGRFWSNETFIQ